MPSVAGARSSSDGTFSNSIYPSSELPKHSSTRRKTVSKRPLNVGIVGGGIGGLYAARLLQLEGHQVHILEGSDRIGGRIRTHYFTHEADQYYEAGAMRVSCGAEDSVTL